MIVNYKLDCVLSGRQLNPRLGPFVWEADPKAIIAAAKRGHQASESIHKEQVAGEGALRQDHWARSFGGSNTNGAAENKD
jgi:hypothetical protein